MGASIGSKLTAAAVGDVGKIRRDPMAMKPFCGYNFGDYWAHWLSFENRTDTLPKIFGVNWFRQDEDGNFLWPGFGENLRVLRWIIDRCEGRVDATETPIGFLPQSHDIDTTGLDISEDAMRVLTTIDVEHWRVENAHFADYLGEYGNHVPAALIEQQQQLAKELDELASKEDRQEAS
jgi:phosphoenolpyruvate carboxykinase (GTP)